MTAAAPTPLPDAPIGAAVCVHDVLAGAAHDRLVEMGLVPGTVVSLRRRAPLGGPILVAIRGGVVAIDRGWASGVLVVASGAVAG